MRLFSLVFVFGCAVGALAQTPPCLAFNDATTSVTGSVTQFGFTGQNERAYQFSPGSALTVGGVRFFTANTTLAGSIFMEVRVYADASGVPGALLASGTWKVDTTVALHWQGASLDHLVTMSPGGTFWIAFVDPGFSDLPEQSTGTALRLATRNGATWTVVGNAQPKIRLFCGGLDDLNVTPFGPSCAGSNLALPACFTNATPTVGNSAFAVEGTGFLSGTAVVRVLGIAPGFPSLPLPGILPPGCAQNIDIFDFTIGASGTGDTHGPTAAGHAVFPLPVPSDPGLVGGFVGLQLAGFDPAFAVPLPLVTTNALLVVVY